MQTITIKDAADAIDAAARLIGFHPQNVMKKLSQLLIDKADGKGLSGRKIQDLARGNAQTNRTALTLLELEGYITPSPHKSIRPYTGDPDDTDPDRSEP